MPSPTDAARGQRSDARRNREALTRAARTAFAAHGLDAALEQVARDAGVSIGTLYRHFPTRQALLEAVYTEEIQNMADAAEALADRDPWDALSTWLRQYVGFAATKKALAEALLETDSDVLATCRTALLGAGDGLLERAQAAGVVRRDTSFTDVARLISSVAVVQTVDDAQRERLVDLALDSLRYTG
jgi:AcrR family transcriptional regulator